MTTRRRSTDRTGDLPTGRTARSGGPVGRPIAPGSTFIKLDREKLERDDILTGAHRPDDHFAGEGIRHLSGRAERLEKEGNFNKAVKARRALNQLHDAQLALRTSWCPSCYYPLHNCICPAPTNNSGPSEEVVNLIMALRRQEVDDKAARKAAKKQKLVDARNARKGR